MIKRLVEKLYYRCFPDRKDEHEIATMPLPKPQVIEYDIVPIQVVKMVDTMFLNNPDEYKCLKECVVKDITRCMAKELEKYITLTESNDPRVGFVEFRARLDVVRRSEVVTHGLD